MSHEAILIVLIFAAALVYSSVGHAGASGYLAAMALMSVPQPIMRPAALILNVLVATIATVRFYQAGCFSWPLFWPFALGSIPLSYVGAKIQLPGDAFKITVGIVLWVAAARLIFQMSTKAAQRARPPIPLATG